MPGKKLPPHLSPFYDYIGEGEYKPKKDIKADIEERSEKKDDESAPEDLELREMLLSKNKKKLLERVREEKMKKKRITKMEK